MMAIRLGAFSEIGGSFPTTFDKRVIGSGKVRLGLESCTKLTSVLSLRDTIELVHGAGDTPCSETWVRPSAPQDVKVADSALLSLTMHAAPEGLGAQACDAALLQVLF